MKNIYYLMPLKFAVIPTKNMYEEYSMSVVSKINNISNCESELDNNYSVSLSARILENKKRNRNVIAIGNSEVEHDMILLHFADKSVRPKSMELDDFISLLENYEEEEDSVDDSDSESDNESDDGNILDMFVKSEKPVKSRKTQQPDDRQTQTQSKQSNQKLNKNDEETEDFELECIVC
jgi:hypothetical protein